MKNLSIFEEYKNDLKKDFDFGLKAKKISFNGHHCYTTPAFGIHSTHTKKISFFVGNKKNKMYKQDCITKVSYRKSKDLHKKNLDYIQKEGKGIDGNNPELYGTQTLNEYKENMDDLNWRIILSPESSQIDLNCLTKEFIKKLEEQTGYIFNWVAANHYDTGKPHTHILINGRDKNGHEVKFRNEMIKTLMRDYSKNICTDMIGFKSDKDIQEKLKEKITYNSFTNIDKTIEKYIMNDNTISIKFRENKNSKILSNRLDYLIKLGLASYNKENQKYTLKQNWKTELQKYGKYNTFLEGFNYANVAPEKYFLHDTKVDGNITGKILKKFIMQKDSNNFAVILKKRNGEVAYVPLSFYPKNCKTGDIITITTDNKKLYIKNYQ